MLNKQHEIMISRILMYIIYLIRKRFQEISSSALIAQGKLILSAKTGHKHPRLKILVSLKNIKFFEAFSVSTVYKNIDK